MFTRLHFLVKIVGTGIIIIVLGCVWISVNSIDNLPHFLKRHQETVGNKVYVPDNCSNWTLESVQKFVFFVGEARTGSTLVGSLLDAHPHIIISNEYNLFSKMAESTTKVDLFRKLFTLSYKQAKTGTRAPAEERGVYKQNVPGMWQGKILDYLEVIGDKKARKTILQLKTNEKWFIKQLTHLQRDLKLNLKVLEVMRNPLDIIATAYLRKTGQYRGKQNETRQPQRVKFEILANITKSVFYHLEIAQTLKSQLGPKHFLEVYSEHLISYPKATLQEICNFLEIHCSDYFYERCQSIMYPSPHLTRNLISWPEQIKANIRQRLQESNVLRRYSFDD